MFPAWKCAFPRTKTLFEAWKRQIAEMAGLGTSDGVLEDMSLPRGSSRTISIVLGLGLVDKVLEFTKDTYTSSADALNVQQNCRTSVTSTSA